MRDRDNIALNASVFWEQSLRQFISLTADSFFISTEQGRLVVVSKAFCDLVGRTRDELLAMPLSDIDTDTDAARNRAVGTSASPDGAARLQTAYRHKDGRPLDVEVITAAFAVDQDRYYFNLIRETENRQARIWSDLTKNSLLELFSKNTTLGEYLDDVAALLRSWSGCRYVGIRSADRKGAIAHDPAIGVCDTVFIDANGLGPANPRPDGSDERVESGLADNRIISTAEGSVFCNDVLDFMRSLPDDDRDRLAGRDADTTFKSVAIIPCERQNALLGAIHLADERANMVPPRVVNFIQSIAPLVGEAMYRFSVEEELRKNHAAQVAINTILRFSQEPLPLEQILEHSLETISGMPWLSDSPSSAVFLIDDSSSALRLIAHRGFAEEWAQRCGEVAAGQCICGRTALDKRMELVFVDSSADAPDCMGPEPHYHYCAPILFDGSVLGVLLINLTGDYVHTDDDEIHLDAIAGALAGIVARKKREQALVESERQVARQAELLARVNDAIIAYDNMFRITYWNAAAEKIYGWSAAEALGGSLFELLRPVGDDIEPRELKTLEDFRGEVVHHSKAGAAIHIETTGIGLKGIAGVPDGYVSVNRDITERVRSDAAMRKLSMAVEQGSDWVLITDLRGTIEYSNKIVKQITGYGKEEIIGQNPRILRSGKHDDSFYKNLWDTILSGATFRSLFINRRKDGELFYIDMSITPLKNEKGAITHFIASGKDVTQQKHMEAQLISLVHYDILTGLPNRTLFKDRLVQALLRGEYSKRMVAVFNLDIDRFKFLNDNYGVETGDEIIKKIAARLAGAVREGDILARMGSDEFGLVLIDVAKKEDFIILVDKLLKIVSEPMQLRGNEFIITMSVGISIFPFDGDTAERILQNAEIAAAKAKNFGRNSYQFYTSDMNARASEFMEIEKQLFGALGNDEFVIHYQPYFDIKTREIVGIEALLRWNNPALGMTEPAQFIPILEETGMIISVSSWIIRTVCEQIVAWQDKGFLVSPISINISPIQFRLPDLAETLEAAIAEYRIDPSFIIFELTESILMHDQKYASEVLTRLRGSGFSISIDDFGTGYSSLSYIKQFPFNYLKIDKSFIKDIMNDPDSGSIVTTVISLAHNLNLKAIAEGVETVEQFNILRILKCDYIQGFFLSTPLTAASMEELFDSKGMKR